jgi:hypothetical protein
MELKDTIGLVSNIATILAVLAGGWFAVFVFLQFAPILVLRILPTWIGEGSKWVILRIEVENKSRIRVHKQTIYLQILEHNLSDGGMLSEWVPFHESAIIPTERPVGWHEPIEIFKSSKGIDPGETLVAERLYYCPSNNVLHVGLQVKAKLGLFGKIATQVRGWNQSWTTTRIVMK